MISYRSLKKLIGESSLERKCRFLFGFALLFLITASFWLYASRTRRLVEYQQLLRAQMMVSRVLQLVHYAALIPAATDSKPAQSTDSLTSPPDQSPTNDVAVASSPNRMNTDSTQKNLIVDKSLPDNVVFFNQTMSDLPGTSDKTLWGLTSATDEFPDNDDGFEARRRFLDEESPEDEYVVFKTAEGDRPRELVYFAAIRNVESCRACHVADGQKASTNPIVSRDSEGGSPASSIMDTRDSIEAAKQGSNESKPPLLSIARIQISLEAVDAQLSRNRAILLATGIVTSFLAMLAAYAIVRYIIVKPVQHLKDVSDEIARGNLNLRADISTGDEFEELSHAFNRMLRHMMTVNDELRSLNDSLDGKIDQLAQANMELFNNNKLKDDFLATISHELRTPLNSILGFSDILQSAANLDERQKRYVHNIQTSGQSLMVQINDLLDLAKIESGKMDLHRTEVQIADLLELQMQQIMPLADRKNIDLRIEAPPQALPLLQQDRSKINQILTNLLSNAIKFTPEGGRVRISSRLAEPEFIEFSVEDTGIGIPLQEQEHIFEKFRQGSTGTGTRDHVKREYEGTGLGLSIVRELARLLGGDVSLRSEFGKGSLFIVRLPIVAPDKKKIETIETAPDTRASTTMPLITTVDLIGLTSNGDRSRHSESLPLDVQSI
ncbi:MAG: HAMP domain-containing sensor histidine kinase [Planctomycetaceae bacterium]